MEEGITRKGFLAAAAAAGAAALIPASQAAAAEPEGEESLISQIDVDAVEGAEALAGSTWVEKAVPQIDVVKSHSGVHIMNEPAYFAFSGWDASNDWAMDTGFAFSGDGLVVKAREVHLEGTNAVYMNGVPVASAAYATGATLPGWEVVTLDFDKRGGMVTMHMNVRMNVTSRLGGGVYVTVPEGFRPIRATGYMPGIIAGSDYANALFEVDINGSLRGYSVASGTNMICTGVWAVS